MNVKIMDHKWKFIWADITKRLVHKVEVAVITSAVSEASVQPIRTFFLCFQNRPVKFPFVQLLLRTKQKSLLNSFKQNSNFYNTYYFYTRNF